MLKKLLFATAIFAGCSDNDTPGQGFVYIESNAPSGNAVLAFTRADDGTLALADTYPTGGAGISAGSAQRLGPLDSDQQLAIANDQLFAVNSGDRTISAFPLGSDGTLGAAKTIDTGAANPVSIGVTDDTMYVVDKVADGSAVPTYARLAMTNNFVAAPAALAQAGGSPTIALVSPDQKLIFGTEFLDGDRPMSAPAGQIDVFVRAADGSLAAAPGSPYALPPDDTGMTPAPPQVALNLIAHPSQNVLYVAFPTRAELGVYTYDATGALTFQRTAPNSGMAICWFALDKSAHYLYSVNSGSATVSTYDISDALHPKEIGAVELAQDTGPSFVDAMGMTQTKTSLPFELALDPDGEHLYVVSQRVTTNANDPAGNRLHVLEVSNGTLHETQTVDLTAAGVPSDARPQGILVR